MTRARLPRVVIAGLAGDAGKSLVSIGLIAALRRGDRRVAPFKKGPDFIDAAWLGAAAGRAGRNLDTFLMPEAAIAASLARAAAECDIAVVEGNRGLFDGMDEAGTHSTAELAKRIAAPVVLVVDATKATRTIAAQVLGCRALDPGLALAGVVLNRVGTVRQEALIRAAVTAETGLPVLGSIPRLEIDLPSRHLGLLTAAEHTDPLAVVERIREAIAAHLDVEAIAGIAARAADVDAAPVGPVPAAPRARIGVLKDRAFSFYYPENLEALARAGAELVETSPLEDAVFPAVDALYAGGGFPEVHAAALSANAGYRQSLRARIEAGLPVWAECGGLMYLSESVVSGGVAHPMVGALPLAVEQRTRPQGHGYVAGRIDRANPFLSPGTALRGHEFHYSRLAPQESAVATVLALDRGVGIGEGRDGVIAHQVVAAYTHVHALGCPDWAPALVRAAEGRAA